MKGKRLRSFSGTVLIMVLTVMLVLIIMLMATLTVVTTASQRIYTKYEENQAYYTARSALDVYVEKLLRDKDGYAMKSAGVEWKYVYADADGNEKLQDSSTHMKQGLALQLDLYNLKSLNKDVSGNALTDFGVMENADSASGVFCTKSGYRDFASTANEYIMYQVQMPSSTDSSSGRSQISDNVKDKSNNTYNDITIKIEVLDRRYSLGGSNADAFEAAISTNEALFASAVVSAANDTAAITGSLTLGDLKEAILLGDRKKDKMTLKVTATAAFRGAEESAVLVFDISDPPIPNGTRAITALGQTSELVNITVIGGISTPADAQAENAIVIGDTFMDKNGDFTSGSGSVFELNNRECLYIGGNINYQNSLTVKANESATSINERPFVYVGGNLTITANADRIKVDGSYPVDLIINGDLIVTTNQAFTGWHGNVYVNGTIDFTQSGDHTNFVDGTVYSSNAIKYNDGDNGSKPLDPSFIDSFTIDDQSATGGDKRIMLPGGGEKILPVKEKIYNEHYADGNNGTDAFTAEDLALVSKMDRERGVRASTTFKDMADGIADVANILYNQNGNWYDGDWKLRPNNELTNGTYYVPSCVGNNWFNLDVKGGGTVELIIAPGKYSGTITVYDNTVLKIYGYKEGTVGAEEYYTFQNMKMYNQEIYDQITGNKPIYVGQSGANIIAPTIYWYFGKNTKVVSDGDDFFAAYIQSPEAAVELRSNNEVDKLYYNDVFIGKKKVNVLGSVLCNELKTMNQAGVAYINPNVPTTAEGDPILNFEAVQYRRN